MTRDFKWVHWLTSRSLTGGSLMFLVGVLYLLLEKSMLKGGRESSASLSNTTRLILGIQIGLIVLAMIVTQSSVASLQARRGLPLGNQVVGWLVLSQ